MLLSFEVGVEDDLLYLPRSLYKFLDIETTPRSLIHPFQAAFNFGQEPVGFILMNTADLGTMQHQPFIKGINDYEGRNL